MMLAYAKGARTFERHVDIDMDGVPVSPYCSRPHQIREWLEAFKKARRMCGGPGNMKRVPTTREIKYLDGLVRGVYARRDLAAGKTLSDEDVYLAIPLQKGQISCRELMRGEVLLTSVSRDAPVMVDMLDSPYARDESLRHTIWDRGL
jgi:N-acetylneuraminate synthase